MLDVETKKNVVDATLHGARRTQEGNKIFSRCKITVYGIFPHAKTSQMLKIMLHDKFFVIFAEFFLYQCRVTKKKASVC